MTEGNHNTEFNDSAAPTQSLNESERQTIVLTADLRRRQHELKVATVGLEPPKGGHARRAQWERARTLVANEASGETIVSPEAALVELQAQRAQLLHHAATTARTAPLEAAYAYTQLAKLAHFAGQEYQ